jgi:SRSO17 transposase
MAERLAPDDYDQLHHFVAAGVWDAAPLEKELLVQADKLVGGSDAVLVIDDTAVPKKGKHSVGVAWQICLSAWQERQLPDAGIIDTRTRRSPSDGGVASFSS